MINSPIIAKKWAYYNDNDPGACAWIRELIKGGHVPLGEVDERSILDVCADDLRGFTQCHFFAGILGWSYALRLAGWPDDRPVWTGSPPCQPFSAAGRQEGRNDARHLAPRFISLVGACRPGVLFGEQVASAEVFGKAAGGARKRAGGPPAWAWLDDLSDRLEAARYAVGASDFPSAGVGAPHIRQRTFFGAVAHERLEHASRDGGIERRAEPSRRVASGGCGDEWLGDSIGARLEGHGGNGDRGHEPGRLGANATGSITKAGASGRLADPDSGGRQWLADGEGRQRDGAQAGWQQGHGEPATSGEFRRLADADGWDAGAEREQRSGQQRQQSQDCGTGEVGNSRCSAGERDAGSVLTAKAREHGAWVAVNGRLSVGLEHAGAGVGERQPGPTNGFWRDADWLFCRDGKWRPVKSSVLGLADGIPDELVRSGALVPASSPLAAPQKGIDRNAPGARRVMRLRGYGNAINPWAAKEFIQAFDASVRHLRLTDLSEMPTDAEDIFG